MGAWGFGPFDNDGIRDVVCESYQPNAIKENLMRLFTDREYCSMMISEPGYMVSAFLLHSLGANLPCFKKNGIEEIKTVLKGKYKVVGSKLIFSDDYDPFEKYELNGKKVHVGEMGASMIGATLIPVDERIKLLKRFLPMLAWEIKCMDTNVHGWTEPEIVQANMIDVLKASTEILSQESKKAITYEVVDAEYYENQMVSCTIKNCRGTLEKMIPEYLIHAMVYGGVTLTNYTLDSDKKLVPKRKAI